MPKVHGKNSVIFVSDSGGTCRNLSGDMNNVVLSWTRANVDVTVFGTCDVDRLPADFGLLPHLGLQYNRPDRWRSRHCVHVPADGREPDIRLSHVGR